MNTFDKHINLQELYGTHALSTRAAARELIDRIKTSEAQSIILDFKNIRFASRSFLDETHAHLSEMDIEVVMKNTNTSVRKMYELVQQPREPNPSEEPDEDTDYEMVTF